MFEDDYRDEDEEYEDDYFEHIDDDEEEDENALWDDEDAADTEIADPPDKPKRKRKKKDMVLWSLLCLCWHIRPSNVPRGDNRARFLLPYLTFCEPPFRGIICLSAGGIASGGLADGLQDAASRVLSISGELALPCTIAR